MIIKRKQNTDEILKAIRDNDGYCICKLEKNEDTKCICKEFIDQNHTGECHCGLYMKEEV